MPIEALSASSTLSPRANVAPPPVMPNVLVLPAFNAVLRVKLDVEVVVAVGDVLAGDLGAGAVDRDGGVGAVGLTAGAAGGGEGGAGGRRDADELAGPVAGRVEFEAPCPKRRR